MIAETAEKTIDRPSTGTPSAPSPPRSRRLLLVGLDRLSAPFLDGLAALDPQIEAQVASTESEALEVARRTTPSLVLVAQTVQGDPFGLMYDLRTTLPDSHILFLMPSSRPEPALRALSSGADDVVAPPHCVTNVMLRARIVRGNAPRRRMHEPTLKLGDSSRLAVDRLSRTVVSQDRKLNLTGREFELLDRLLEARGGVVSRNTILADIWGSAQQNEAVLDATVHRLRRKLEKDPTRPRILTTIRGKGYRLETRHLRVLGF